MNLLNIKNFNHGMCIYTHCTAQKRNNRILIVLQTDINWNLAPQSNQTCALNESCKQN